MTLGNMRQFGMKRLDVSCHGYLCEHRAMIDVSRYPDNAIVALAVLLLTLWEPQR
jgi:hypothetical protein